jgi:hypothetical protein
MPSIVRPTPCREPRVRARRHGERGTALVEAAFMMPMFVILFFTSLYLHNLNSKQISLNISTRANAWAFAMSNCNKGPASPESESLPVGSSGNATQMQMQGSSSGSGLSAASAALGAGSVTGAISSAMSGITSLLASVFADPEGSQSKSNVALSWRLPNVYEGGATDGPRTTNVHQTVTVACNEQAENGSIVTAVEDIICVIVPSAPFC